jgi:hypothetical protein
MTLRIDAIVTQIAPAAYRNRLREVFRGANRKPAEYWSAIAEIAAEVTAAKNSGFTYICPLDGSGDVCIRSKATATDLIRRNTHRLATEAEIALFEQARKIAGAPLP